MMSKMSTFTIIVIASCWMVSAQDKTCYIAYECAGSVWINYINIFGWGYKSLAGPNTSINNADLVYCYGAYACEQISFISNVNLARCWGSNSCANTAYIVTQNDLLCYGLTACENSNITANVVACEGDQSCINSTITAGTINAYGSHSVFGSVISFLWITENNIYFHGYQSGFGATVKCKSGQTCNIYCYYNGCQMLYADCEHNSICNILLNDNDPTVTVPPITNEQHIPQMYDIKYNASAEASNELCDKNPSKFIFDNRYERTEEININEANGGPVCCRGDASCHRAGSILFAANTSSSLVCSGKASCTATIITGSASVFCEGQSSCLSASIHGVTNMYCLGKDACRSSTVTHSRSIYCSGSQACYGGAIRSNGSDISVYLLGRRSGNEINIHCDVGDQCEITCGGFQSCASNAELFCTTNCIVYCNTDTGCPIGNYISILLVSPANLPTNDITPTNVPPATDPTVDVSIHPTSDPINAQTFASEMPTDASINVQTVSDIDIHTTTSKSSKEPIGITYETIFVIVGVIIFLILIILVIILFRMKPGGYNQVATKDEESKRSIVVNNYLTDNRPESKESKVRIVVEKVETKTEKKETISNDVKITELTHTHTRSHSTYEEIDIRCDKDHEKICNSMEIKLKMLVHDGHFGCVHKAEWENKLVAAKFAKSKEIFESEMLVKTIAHPNIIKVFNFKSLNDAYLIVMEYMPGGSVRDYVYDCDGVGLQEKFFILIKACGGLRYLTENGIHHCDIAARNILLGEVFDWCIDNNTKIKISDFGMATRSLSKRPINRQPLKWTAPELFTGGTINEKTDVYMFAITMCEILNGKEPYDESEENDIKINLRVHKKRPEIKSELPHGLEHLITECWHESANKRPTFKEIEFKLAQIVAEYKDKKSQCQRNEMKQQELNSDDSDDGLTRSLLDISFKTKKIQFKLAATNVEIKITPEFDTRNKILKVGSIKFGQNASLLNISRGTENNCKIIIWINDHDYMITCESEEHANWLEKKIVRLKRVLESESK